MFYNNKLHHKIRQPYYHYLHLFSFQTPILYKIDLIFNY